MKVAIGSDHVGIDMKAEIKTHLEELGVQCVDFGTFSRDRTDYPLYAARVGCAVAGKQCDRGILICGTGVGMCIAANKIKGVRAVVCTEPYSAKLSREHNDTNVLALGARVIGVELAKMIVEIWLEAEYQGGRHEDRLRLISRLEEGLEITLSHSS